MKPGVHPRIYGIIGNPVGHSLSPLLHGTGFRTLGLDAVHLPWRILPEQLPAFMESFRLLGIAGCCVTIPHKEKALPFADRASRRAMAVGAANTLSLLDGEIVADNTDVSGFLAPLEGMEAASVTRALLLGAGGAARAAAVALREKGVADICVASRSDASAGVLAEEFGLVFVPWKERGDTAADLIVNATPLGMKGELERETPYPARFLARGRGLVYDMIYTPIETALIRDATAAGWRTVSGLDMFIGQADGQFRIWTGRPLPEAAVRAATRVLYGEAFNER